MADAVKGRHNVKRRARMKSLPLKALADIGNGGSLSASAAIYELHQRGFVLTPNGPVAIQQREAA